MAQPLWRCITNVIHVTDAGSDEIVTFRLAPKDRATIQRLVDEGEFRNRSDFLRYAVKAGLREFESGTRAKVDLDMEDYSLGQGDTSRPARARPSRKEMHRR